MPIYKESPACDLCGAEHRALRHGICPACRHRLGLDAPGVLPPGSGGGDPIHPYTRSLARRALLAQDWLHGRLTEPEAADLLTEAFYRIAQDLQAGRLVELEYLGELARLRLHPSGPVVVYRADPRIIEGGTLQ